MSKLRLDFDALAVESFETADGEEGSRGTVRANSGSIYDTNINQTCPATGGCGSCYASCVQGACGSPNQTFVESCVPGACPDSIWQMCASNGGRGCYVPLTGTPPTE